MYTADITCAGAPLIVTGGIAVALLVEVGTEPVGTGGTTGPRPLASRTSVVPGGAFTWAPLLEETVIPCTEKRPSSDVVIVSRNGELVCEPDVTTTLADGIPAGISKGTCALIWVGLT